MRLLCHLFDFEEVRIHSRRPEAFAAKLEADLGRKITVTETWKDCFKGADIMVEASRLSESTPLFKTDWIKPGTPLSSPMAPCPPWN